jgi:cytochrome c oxidase assembly factor CtaG
MGKPAAAVVVMAAIIAVLFVLGTPRSTSRSSAPLPVSPARQ